MKILLKCGSAKGVNYGKFAIESPTKFTWEAGREFGESNLDDAIYRHNLIVKSKSKKTGKTLNAFYQFTRYGPVVKCLRGPSIEPRKFDDKWYCSYRYKAVSGDPENWIKGMWWHKEEPKVPRKDVENAMKEMCEEDEPLF